MASAIDSGVDTGNDSNDSSAQEKLSKMDLEISPQSKLSDSHKETTDENRDIPHSSCEVPLVESSPGTSMTHLQPCSLMHGYEYQPSRASNARERYCFLVNVSRKPKIEIGGVFVSGGPFGTEYSGPYTTEYKAEKMISKLRGARLRHHSAVRFKCLKSASCQPVFANYAKLKDAVRMCRAACHNNTVAMKEMLDAGLSPNCHDSYKRTPLHLAACMGYKDMVKLLLDHGADPNAKDSIGNTPLHLVACTNHVSVITLLLKAGTRVSERDMAGHSPLQLAITKFNIMKRSVMPHPVLKEQVCQVISMLTEYMRRKEGATVDPDLLNKFESLVRVSDSSEQVESNIRDLLSNLSSLSLSSTS